MKPYLLIALLALAACGKQNDVPILQHEAATLAKYYQPKLDTIDARIQAIMKRGEARKPDGTPEIPADFPGVKQVGLQLQEARDTAVKLRGIVGSAGQTSPVEKRAEAAAKDGKVTELRKLIHDSEAMIADGITLINSDLDAVESWLYQFDAKTLAMIAPAMAEQPGQPETAGTPATGQPPAAVQQGSAAPAPQGSPAPTPQPAQGSAQAPAQPKQPAPKQ
jgi:hypothetical protein